MNIEIKDKQYSFELLNSESDIEKVAYLQLFEDCFGKRENVDKIWFDWYNLNSPFGKNNIYVIRDKENGVLTCAYGLSPTPFVINNERRKGLICTNNMTHPDYRGLGLYTKLGSMALKAEFNKGAYIALGIPNVNAIAGHIKVGWQQMPNLFFFEKKKNEFVDTNVTDVTIEQHFLHQEGLNHLFEKYNFYILRTAAFLNWRYFERPYKNYEIVCYRNEEYLQGYAVIKLFEDNQIGIRKLHIIDYAYRDEAALKKILAKVECIALDKGADLINLWSIRHSNDANALLDNNYIESKDSNMFILHSVADYVSSETDNWHIVIGDNDVY